MKNYILLIAMALIVGVFVLPPDKPVQATPAHTAQTAGVGRNGGYESLRKRITFKFTNPE